MNRTGVPGRLAKPIEPFGFGIVPCALRFCPVGLVWFRIPDFRSGGRRFESGTGCVLRNGSVPSRNTLHALRKTGRGGRPAPNGPLV